MNTKYFTLLSVSGFVIALDQLTKMYIHTQFRLGESINAYGSFFDITYVRNYGAAFGFLADSAPSFREVFFLSMPPVALIIILMILRSVPKGDRWQTFGLSLVFSGAIGNYIDRIRFRYVIDFLDFHIGTYTWPAFNVADSAIVCGVTILITLMIFVKEEETDKSSTSSSAKAS